MQLVEKADTHKDKKQGQLKIWAKQSEVYKAWLDAPQTKQMYQVAEALKYPSVQRRIHQIQTKLQQKQTDRDTRQRQSQRRDRGQGLGL